MTDEREQQGGVGVSIPRWERPPRWYLWDGGFMSVGTGTGVIPPHAHHAIQIGITVEGTTGIKGPTGDWHRAAGTIVRHDVEHSYDASGASGAMIFVDPESIEGTWLRSAMTGDITIVPDARLMRCADALRTFLDRPLEAMDVGDLIRLCVASCCTGVPPARRLDERVTTVLKAIRESDDLRMPLEDAADRAHLSPSRFAHLFKQQVGLPFRRYMLWRKLTRAMLSIGRERTLAAAAHASDFADAAHLTRTFYQMFGIQPSLLMRGAFFEIPSPFSTPD